jgi:hypothetical protein
LIPMNEPPPKKSLPKTIDEVLLRLDEIIHESIQDKTYLCLFAFVYRETTAEVKKAIENGRFDDPDRMEKMDVIFANLYIHAYENYKNKLEVSKCWDHTFDAQKQRLAVMQHVMLGMNAHINHDLSVAAAQVAQGEQIIGLKNDFMIINDILSELTDRIQDSLGRISMPMKIMDFVGWRYDEKIINFSIRKARDFAWLNAMELALLKNDLLEARKKQIDLRVMEFSRMIMHPPGKAVRLALKLISVFETKDPNKIMEKLQR